jgi:hypothetical protein
VTAAETFDLDEYTRTAAGSHRGELELEEYDAAPLLPETLRSLAYLRNVERATMSHLRGLLITPTHKDALVTAFLTTWAYEKYWIADALDGIIAWHEANGAPPAPQPLTLAPRERSIREAIYGNLVGVDLIPTHLATGAVDEWITQAAYTRILDLDPNDRLAQTLGALLQVKRRQLRFFEATAAERLAESARAQRLAAKHLRRIEWPVGSRAEPRGETRRFFERLFSTVPALVAEIDGRVDALPGLGGLRLLERSLP